MTKETSPFSPGKPAPVQMFAGRGEEIERIRRDLKQVVNGSQQNLFLVGERGIGKTSLAHFTRQLAITDFQCLGVHIFLGGVASLEEMTRKLVERLVEETRPIQGLWDRMRTLFAGRIKELDLFGLTVRFEAEQGELRSLAENFPGTIKSICDKLEDQRKGLVIVLDDVNGLAAHHAFPNFVKSFVDEAATGDYKLRLLLVLVGLNETRDQLLSAQPSLGRIFEIVEIGPLPDAIVADFYRKAFKSVDMKVGDEPLKLMVRFSGGLPALMHEVGDAVFWTDEDGAVDTKDAMKGIFVAADNVGKKYLERQVYQAIRSDRYRSILHKLVSENLGMHFKKADLEKKLHPSEKAVFNNFLQKMKGLDVLRAGDQQGDYDFANELFYLYMRLESFRAAEQRKPDRR